MVGGRGVAVLVIAAATASSLGGRTQMATLQLWSLVPREITEHFATAASIGRGSMNKIKLLELVKLLRTCPPLRKKLLRSKGGSVDPL